MTVSFIIPLYNCLALTQAMVASLQATMPGDITPEIILVDDGSTDGTRSWLRTLAAPFRVVLNETNLGYAGANNRGAAVATGEILVLLNNDLVLTRRWLEPMLAAHHQLGSRAGVVGNVQRRVDDSLVDHSGVFINYKGKPEHKRSLRPGWIRWMNPIVRVAAVTGACALISRDLWEKLGGFDERFANGGEDVDFCFRVAREGRVNVVALRSVIRHHVSASPGRKLRDEENSRRLAQKWRAELEQLALRQWCWHYLHENWNAPQNAADHATGRAALLYAMHLRGSPPDIAVTGMHVAMDREFARWSTLLD